jgi:hypothetical protein
MPDGSLLYNYFQWLNTTTLVVTCPASFLPGGDGNELTTVSVQGSLFNEATFIS